EHYSPAWNNLGNAIAEIEGCDEAIDCYTRAISNDGTGPSYRLNRAVALARCGRYEEARDDVRQALSIAPGLMPIIAALPDLEPMRSRGYLEDLEESQS